MRSVPAGGLQAVDPGDLKDRLQVLAAAAGLGGLADLDHQLDRLVDVEEPGDRRLAELGAGLDEGIRPRRASRSGRRRARSRPSGRRGRWRCGRRCPTLVQIRGGAGLSPSLGGWMMCSVSPLNDLGADLRVGLLGLLGRLGHDLGHLRRVLACVGRDQQGDREPWGRPWRRPRGSRRPAGARATRRG